MAASAAVADAMMIPSGRGSVAKAVCKARCTSSRSESLGNKTPAEAWSKRLSYLRAPRSTCLPKPKTTLIDPKGSLYE